MAQQRLKMRLLRLNAEACSTGAFWPFPIKNRFFASDKNNITLIFRGRSSRKHQMPPSASASPGWSLRGERFAIVAETAREATGNGANGVEFCSDRRFNASQYVKIH
jgi:hypothetical protein